jgi:hypothetical protein
MTQPHPAQLLHGSEVDANAWEDNHFKHPDEMATCAVCLTPIHDASGDGWAHVGEGLDDTEDREMWAEVAERMEDGLRPLTDHALGAAPSYQSEEFAERARAEAFLAGLTFGDEPQYQGRVVRGTDCWLVLFTDIDTHEERQAA